MFLGSMPGVSEDSADKIIKNYGAIYNGKSMDYLAGHSLDFAMDGNSSLESSQKQS